MRAVLLLLLPALLAAQGLRIRVAGSSGPVHVVGSRTAAPLVVEVLGQDGAPVPGAAVSFRLPPSGPGGVFSNGLTTDVVLAGPDGRAAASSIRWNRTPGEFEIRVAAVMGESRASLVSARRLLPSAADAAAPGGRGRRRLLLAAAGAAAGSVAAGLVLARRSSASTESRPAGQTLSVGAPVITVGGPG